MRGTRNVYYFKKEKQAFHFEQKKIFEDLDPIFFCCFDFDDFLG